MPAMRSSARVAQSASAICGCSASPPEVRGHGGRQLEQQAHDQRRADAVGRGIDAALHQERRRHRQRQVERRGEAHVRPARALERQPLA